MKHLEIQNVSQSFGDIHVLDGISLSVSEGEFVSVLGPSGSGKSTLFGIIGGLINPNFGDILLNGKSIKGKRGSISYTPQTSSLLPWRTILDNVLLGQELSGKKDINLAKNMIERAGLKDYEGAYPHELSGGMKQRASFIRSVISPQSLILLDEPFSALDEFTRTDMQKWLLSMWEENTRSILFVTHNIEEAIFLSDRIIILSPRPATVLEEYKVPFERPRQEELLLTEEFLQFKKEIYQQMKSVQM
ncbi:ABC transporter ATP-binding protein [Piscibacillus sp. B03]|uniref:ABC transporter ATP-binding protein n=1 Tax=Piscibacillus sp. B03 TaxID=3457430 RepID=UPI003FCC9679